MSGQNGESFGDLVYREPCGCKAVFFKCSAYLSSRFFAGTDCRMHSHSAPLEVKNDFLARAKSAIRRFQFVHEGEADETT